VTRVAPVTSFAALALHGLAHVPLRHVASLFEPDYVAWCAATLPAQARKPLAADGPAIGAEADAADAAMALQWLPRLHATTEAFARHALVDLASLTSTDDAEALAVLQRAAPTSIEWLRADLALAANAFEIWRLTAEPALRDTCAAIAAALEKVPAAMRPTRVDVAWSLGAHGRGFADLVMVGAPAAWNAIDPDVSAVVALHEHAVVSARGDYLAREWTALRSVARALASTTLRDAHARWLASRDLGSLTPILPAAVRDAAPFDRARVLAALSL